MIFICFAFLRFVDDEEGDVGEGQQARLLQKNEDFYEVTVPGLTETQFKENFRLGRETVASVVELLEEDDANGKPMELKVLVLLYYLGSIISFRKVALIFNLSISTAWSFVDEVVRLLCGLKDVYIKFGGLFEVSDRFQADTGIRGIVGAVDGCHIPIPRPSQNEHAYVNRKHTHSINLMGVCDDAGRFLDVCIGWPGSVHDSRVFKNSPLGQALTDRAFRNRTMPEGSFLIGDCAFQLETWMMTPFRENQMRAPNGGNDGHTAREKKTYNKKLSSARVVIEHAFGVLKGRFRRLTNLETKSVKKAIDITCAACVLHNMCKLRGDLPDMFEEAVPVDEQPDGDGGVARVAEGAAIARRRALVDEVLAL